MNPFGIRTVIFEPGGIATPIWNKIKERDYLFIYRKYNKTKNLFIKHFVEAGNRALLLKLHCENFNDLIKKNPGQRDIIAENVFMEYLKLIIPTGIMDHLISKIFKMDYGEKMN